MSQAVRTSCTKTFFFPPFLCTGTEFVHNMFHSLVWLTLLSVHRDCAICFASQSSQQTSPFTLKRPQKCEGNSTAWWSKLTLETSQQLCCSIIFRDKKIHEAFCKNKFLHWKHVLRSSMLNVLLQALRCRLVQYSVFFNHSIKECFKTILTCIVRILWHIIKVYSAQVAVTIQGYFMWERMSCPGQVLKRLLKFQTEHFKSTGIFAFLVM